MAETTWITHLTTLSNKLTYSIPGVFDNYPGFYKMKGEATMKCYSCQVWDVKHEKCLLPGSLFGTSCPHYGRLKAQMYIENEARANNLWHLFQNLEEEEWNFIADLLVSYNERKNA